MSAGNGAAVTAEELGESAIQTYRELVRHGSRYTGDDIARTQHRVTQARAIIAS